MDAVLRILQYRSGRPGPKLLVLGGVHGDEICGTRAIEDLAAQLDSGEKSVRRGMLTLVPVVNPKARALNTRAGDRNLNRDLRRRHVVRAFEDLIANALSGLLEEHDALLDLHSFPDEGAPFLFVGPRDNDGDLEPFWRSAEERAFARSLGIDRFLTGWLPAYARAVHDMSALGAAVTLENGYGTTEAMRRCGGIAVTVECGSNLDPASVQVAARAIEGALRFYGLVTAPPFPETDASVLRLQRAYIRRDVKDAFAREWVHLDTVPEGAEIARYGDGETVIASEALAIVFPWSHAQVGSEWFYLATPEPSG